MARVINQGDVDAIDFTVSCTVQTNWEDQLFTAQQVVEFLAAGDTTLIYFNEEPFDYTNSAATAIGIILRTFSIFFAIFGITKIYPI